MQVHLDVTRLPLTAITDAPRLWNSAMHVLRRLVLPIADDVRVRGLAAGAAPVRCYTDATARNRGMSAGALSGGLRLPRRVSISDMW